MHKSNRPGSTERHGAYANSSWACIAFTGEHERASTAPTVEVLHRHRAARACSVDVLVVSVVHGWSWRRVEFVVGITAAHSNSELAAARRREEELVGREKRGILARARGMSAGWTRDESEG